MFELHLLESGISGRDVAERDPVIFSFELHLLESGISGKNSTHDRLQSLCLNSTYWNLVFRDPWKPQAASAREMFELHLLESGISGVLLHVGDNGRTRLNSTYWNLVFRVSPYKNLIYSCLQLYHQVVLLFESLRKPVLQLKY